MGQLTTHQWNCIVEQFLITKSTIATLRKFRRIYGFSPNRRTVDKIIHNWNTRATLQNLNKIRRGRPKTGRSDANIDQVKAFIERHPTSSLRNVASASELIVSLQFIVSWKMTSTWSLTSHRLTSNYLKMTSRNVLHFVSASNKWLIEILWILTKKISQMNHIFT